MLAFTPGQASAASQGPESAGQDSALARLSPATRPDAASTGTAHASADTPPAQAHAATEVAATGAASQDASQLPQAVLHQVSPVSTVALPADTSSEHAVLGKVTEAAHSAGYAVDAGAASDAELARQAALFNQFCNAELAVDAGPLGFVPLDHSPHFIDLHVVAQDSAYQQLQAA